MKNYDVLVYGPIFCDLIFTDLPSMPVLGKEIFASDLSISVGGSAITAVGLHRLGARVGLITDLGNDPLSNVAFQILEEFGIDRSLVHKHPYPLQQVTVALSFAKDRAFITRFQRPQNAQDLAGIFNKYSTQHLHVCSLLAVLDAPDAINVAHAAGATVSMDPGWDDQLLQDSRISAFIEELDIFMPSETEIQEITQMEDLKKAIHQTIHKLRHGDLVIKIGSKGAIGYQNKEQKETRVSSISITPVDTTGAGDAFDAGFLFAYLKGLSFHTCMQYGVVCGGLTTTAPGGATAFPTLTEVQKWLLKLPS